MTADIIFLREFYGSPRGQQVAATLQQLIAPHLPRTAAPPAPIITFGYAPPIVPQPHCLYLMPALQGVAPTPNSAANQAVLCDEHLWPLADNSAECVVLLHALEHCQQPAAVLAEAARVLRPYGKLIIIAANRSGLWARAEATPFGRGQPFSATQLRQLLNSASFVAEHWQRGLFFPPVKSALLLKLAPWVERAHAYLYQRWRLNFGLGGVVLMVGSKQLYAPRLIGKALPAKKLGFAPLPGLASPTTRIPTSKC